ncbi:MAG: hypothetical protein HN936_12570 [Bacteroidetes bacterium]|nr:hypothetical protein [Bacteroidota bacterium]
MDKYDFSDSVDPYNRPGGRFYRLFLYLAKAILIVPAASLTYLAYLISSKYAHLVGKFVSIRDLSDEEVEVLRYRAGYLIIGRDYEEYAIMLIVGVLIWIFSFTAAYKILDSSPSIPNILIFTVPIVLIFLGRLTLFFCEIIKGDYWS